MHPTTYVFLRDHFAAPIAHLPGSGSSKASVAARVSPVLYKLRGGVPTPPASVSFGGAPHAAGGNLEGAAAVQPGNGDTSLAEGSAADGAPTTVAAAAAAAVAADGAGSAVAASGGDATGADALSADHPHNGAFVLPYRMIMAVATLDAVVLYDTQTPYPIAAVANMHYDKLTDIAWCVS